MALHESVLEEFGLAPLWVRRGMATRGDEQGAATEARPDQAQEVVTREGTRAGGRAAAQEVAREPAAHGAAQETAYAVARVEDRSPVGTAAESAHDERRMPARDDAAITNDARNRLDARTDNHATRTQQAQEPQHESAPHDPQPAQPRAAQASTQAPAPERLSEPPTFDLPPDDDFAWFDDPGAPAPAPAEARRAAPALPSVQTLDWDALAARVAGCEACRLCEKRTNTVFGVGDREADWMLVGEAPGENEDRQGEPFVGQAGKLLDNMLHSLALARGTNVYIANVIKCRPPGNRNPQPDEVARCEPYLQRQVALVKPKLIVALGRFAAQSLLKTEASISSLRGRVHAYEGVPVIVTYHPAYLLRSLPDKSKAWVDLCLARDTWLANGGAPSNEAK
ncbi:uracil-DNA glycosylase [Paraburkholderia antibiotica]|uniref:Type-4 uracil-DNA glycosylase n=1 Tax=Paraburkholderia antibiotica TaxID=2728839 RepID=A0A7X9X1Z9_9BURK|nr:uracil-DNA glycosylase [Paraburkholderia antibiotica]NML29943.1 uracil-DNA glycosylase [Paraburkholderia antibiotica]